MSSTDKYHPDSETPQSDRPGQARRTWLPAAAGPSGSRTTPDAASQWSGDPDDVEDDHFDEDDGDEAEPPTAGDGHNLMDRAAIDRALAAAGYDGSFEHLSTAEEQRVRLLLHYRNVEPLFRRHLVGHPTMISRLAALDAAAPNFVTVTRLVIRAAKLSLVAGCPLRMPPILMVGAPGVGKTRYVRSLAAALGTSFDVINGATIPDVGSLTGYPPVWRGAGPGRIARALVAAPTSGPLLFLDEAEKIVDYEESRYPLDKLLTLLEPESAVSFEDEHLHVPMRAENVIWVFAANSLEGLSRPFLDRTVKIMVPSLSREQQDVVLETMLAEVAARAGLSITFANTEALVPIRRLGLRRCRLAFELAIASAVEQDRRFLRRQDLEAAVALLGAGRERPAIGFMRPGQSDD